MVSAPGRLWLSFLIMNVPSGLAALVSLCSSSVSFSLHLFYTLLFDGLLCFIDCDLEDQILHFHLISGF